MSWRPAPVTGPSGVGARAVLRDLAARGAVVLAVAGCVAVAVVPDPGRPVLTAAGTAVAVAVAAAVTRSRLVGTVAVLAATTTVLLAAALDASDLRPVQVVAAGALLLVALGALERCEAAAGQPLAVTAATVTVLRGSRAARLGPVAGAVGASALVAATAARDVVPSVALVLGGLVAAVAALVVTTRAHRDEQA
jgi:hypothetical protein